MVYHRLKCELVTQLCFPPKTIFCNLIEFSMTKTTQNSISLTPQVKKFPNSFIRSLLIKGFSIMLRAHPNFPLNFYFNLNEFVWKIYSIFNKVCKFFFGGVGGFRCLVVTFHWLYNVNNKEIFSFGLCISKYN
jgi:hypothetical protein